MNIENTTVTEPRAVKCRTKFCRKPVWKSGHSPYCSKCKALRWKEAHPVSYHFNKLKYRAIQRGHEFALSRARFKELWESGLKENHGKTKFSLCIDRVDDKQGYHDGNVRLLTLSENSRRQFVPYFKTKAEEEAAIKELEAKMAAEPLDLEAMMR